MVSDSKGVSMRPIQAARAEQTPDSDSQRPTVNSCGCMALAGRSPCARPGSSCPACLLMGTVIMPYTFAEWKQRFNAEMALRDLSVNSSVFLMLSAMAKVILSTMHG